MRTLCVLSVCLIILQVHVIVEDENDNPPMFEGPWYSGHIREAVSYTHLDVYKRQTVYT